MINDSTLDIHRAINPNFLLIFNMVIVNQKENKTNYCLKTKKTKANTPKKRGEEVQYGSLFAVILGFLLH